MAIVSCRHPCSAIELGHEGALVYEVCVGLKNLPASKRDKSSGMKTKREAHAINRLSAAQPLLFAQQVRQITLYKGEPRSKQRLECWCRTTLVDEAIGFKIQASASRCGSLDPKNQLLHEMKVANAAVEIVSIPRSMLVRAQSLAKEVSWVQEDGCLSLA